MPNPDNPSENDIVREEIKAAKSRWQSSFPAIVLSYDEATLRATVQPAIRISSKSGQQVTPKPVTIPVDWLSWGDFVIQGKLTAGDEVVVECMDRNWNTWLLSGGVVDDVAIGGSQAGYAVAKPRALSVAKRPASLGAGVEVKIGKRDGTSTVIIRADGSVFVQSTSVRLGSAAPAPAAAVARDSDSVLAGAVLFAWGAAVAGATGVPNPWTAGVTPVGDILATSVEVTST